MANTRHNSTQLPLVTDGAKSVDAFYGPWKSLGEFGSWWSETFAGVDIPAGTLAGVINGTNVDRYCRIVPADGTAYWKKLDYINSVIEFGGIVSDMAVSSGTAGIMGNRATVFYDEGSDTLLLKSGNNYYGNWTNSYDYGEIDDGRVYPYEGKIYVDITTGQLFYSTSNKLVPAEGGGNINLTDDEWEAIDSGITAELVEELKRLKAMNIQYSFNKNELTLTDGNNTQTYNLAEGGGSTNYGEPTVMLSYSDSIGNSGGTLNPVIHVSQSRVVGESSSTLSYSSVSEIKSTGATVEFSLSQGAAGVSINSQTGVLTFTENTSGALKIVQVSVNVRNVNEVGLDGEADSNEIRQGKVYIRSVAYGEPESNGDGSYTVSPIYTASNGETYTYDEYVAADISKETFSFEITEGSSMYGASLNTTTGAVTYDISDMLDGLSGGEIITTSFLNCVQSNVNTITVDVPDFFGYTGEDEYVANDSWINNVGGNKTDSTVTTFAYRSGCSAAPSIAAVKDDVFYFKLDVTSNYATHAWFLETQGAAFTAGDAAYAKGQSYDVNNVESVMHTGQAKNFIIYKVADSDAAYLTYSGFRKAMGYYKIE